MSGLLSTEPFRRSTPVELGFAGPGADPVPAATAAAAASTVPRVAPSSDLIGIAPEVYDQINAAYAAGKRHFMFFGPPGTGKTELARYVAGQRSRKPPELITASADWSSQDLIGGYQPVGAGQIAFKPGTLLRAYDRAIVIDEFNRCDIDRVFGPLFSLLAGVDTVLPYVDQPGRGDARDIVLAAAPSSEASPSGARYSFGPDWQIIATINTSDKTALAQMSFALMRRFAWIYVAPPADRSAFVHALLDKLGWRHGSATSKPLLSQTWDAVNAVRELGAAPFIDVLRYCDAALAAFDATATPSDESAAVYVDALSVFVIPLLDGIREDEAQTLLEQLVKLLQLESESEPAIRLGLRLSGVAG